MEENSNQFEPQAAAPGGSNNTVRKVVKGIIIAVVAILVIVLLINLLVRSPKEAAKGFIKNIYASKSEKAFKYVDYTGYAVIQAYLYDGNDTDDLEDYDDFWDDYKDALDDSDFDDYVEEMEDYFDENAEDEDDWLEEYMEDGSVKVKKVKSSEKITSHLYKVKVVVEYQNEDGDESSTTLDIYVMKKGLKSYVVYFDGMDDYAYSETLEDDYYTSSYYYDYDW